AIDAIVNAGEMLTIAFIILSASMIIIATVDVPFQIWDYTKQLRMTKQEVKDEMKQTEGMPE
ncbi:MAG: flagellar biosynthetic protein FlhB, partial [Phycisphaerae bacterium]|nr:flagellar biosynthetic protein FlhB [Phycisphaerae bacterium]